MIFVLHQKWLWIGEMEQYHGNNKMNKTKLTYYCKEKDCKKEIYWSTALYGSGLCHSCAVKDKNNPNFKGDKAISNQKYFCEDCGEEVSNYKAIRCQSCASKDENNNNYKGNKAVKRQKYYCIESECNNEILYNCWKYGSKLCKYCAQKGELHSNYIEGLDRNYPIEFNQKLKDEIRQRDNYKCQKCSMTEEEHIIVYGKVLENHHIDYNKKNCVKDNLITLCKQCNIRANYNRDYWENYYKEKILILRKEK